MCCRLLLKNVFVFLEVSVVVRGSCMSEPIEPRPFLFCILIKIGLYVDVGEELPMPPAVVQVKL